VDQSPSGTWRLSCPASWGIAIVTLGSIEPGRHGVAGKECDVEEEVREEGRESGGKGGKLSNGAETSMPGSNGCEGG